MRTMLVALVALGLAGAAHAEGRTSPSGTLMNMDMDQLSNVPLGNVYAASRVKQKARRAASNVTVITAQEIRRHGWRTLADILRNVRGFYVTYDRNYSYLGVRGFGRPADYNSRVQILLDSHRLNDPVYGAAYLGTEALVDVDLIDRVEIVRGPSSSVYGTGAFFAVINIITREGANMRSSELSAEAGGFRHHRGRVTLGHADDDVQALISSTSYKREGDVHLFFPEFADPTTTDNLGFADDADRDRSESRFAKLVWHGFTADAGRVSRDKLIPTASFGSVFDTPNTHTTDELEFARLRFDRALDPQTTLMAQAYLNRSRYNGEYFFDVVGRDRLVDNRDTSAGDWWVGEVQLTRTFGKHRVVAGAEYQRNQRQDQANFDEAPFNLRLDDHHDSFSNGVYLESELQLADPLILIAGVRHDFFSTSGPTTNPRVALIWTPRDSTVLRALYGTAFRAPSSFELFYQDGGISQKPPDMLKNERIATYEGIWEEQLSSDVRASASYYYYQMYDLIDQFTDPADGLIVFTNRDTIDAKGVELALSGRLPHGIEGRASIGVQRTRDRVSDLTLTNSPEQQAKLSVSVPVAHRKAYISLDGQFVGARITQAGATDPAYTVANVTLFAPRWVHAIDVSASIYNMFDRHFADLGGPEHRQDLLRQDGRDFRLKATAHF